MNDDDEKYAHLIQEDREAAAQEGRDPVVPADPTPQAEVYDPAVHGRVEDQPQHYQPQQPAQQQQYQLPDVYDDPIGHFTGRLQEIESVALGNIYNDQRQQMREWETHLKETERHGREEFGEDFNAATDHLINAEVQQLNAMLPDNSQHAVLWARQHGYQSPAQAKHAILQAKIVATAQEAARQGVPLSHMVYRLSGERGYTHKRAATNSQRRQLGNILKNSQGKDFDDAWSHYARLNKREDELARGR